MQSRGSLSRGSGRQFFPVKILIDIICFFFLLAEEISISHLSIPMAWELAGSEEDHLNEVELSKGHPRSFHNFFVNVPQTCRKNVASILN